MTQSNSAPVGRVYHLEVSMRARWLALVLVFAAVLGSYAALRPVNAQTAPFPFAVGDTVQFTTPTDRIRDCRIEAIQNTFVRCERPPRVQGGDHWINVSTMSAV